ncbi:MAG: ABC transporter ATP-binding protein [Acidimicrobiia bacterium]|nr:ABC transporter ATP-binding protein [Acidimicrobiia bacterium]
MTHAVEIKGLTVGYDGIAVVRNLDLYVDEGEVVALLGPNGAGKTTTLFALAGLLAPLSGTITILGNTVRPNRPQAVARSGLAFVPEDRGLFYDLTVNENLRLSRKKSWWRFNKSSQDPSSVIDPLDLFPVLRDLGTRPAGLLSGGEQQMLALARALSTNPRVLLVDEMSLGLAPIVVEQLLPMIRLIADSGTAVILVEQHVQLALEYADRGYVLRHGDCVLEGVAKDLLAQPDRLEVSYLGENEL